MGKTIQIASLIHTVKPGPYLKDSSSIPETKRKTRQIAIDKAFRATIIDKAEVRTCAATLVVAPTSLLSQWANELQRASNPGTISVMVWHGSNRALLDTDIDGLDVVITSYGVLVSEHAKHENKSSYRSPLFESECELPAQTLAHHRPAASWFRIGR